MSATQTQSRPVLTPAEVAEANNWFDEVDAKWLAKMEAHRKAGTRPCFNCNTAIPLVSTHCNVCGMAQDKEVV